ncbi:MAG: membrane protein insertion efficiency factor YidD [Hyphomonadaceae bacterium]
MRFARLPAAAAIAAIRAYQWTLSPFVGRGCRHLPTCSHYAAGAIGAHGLWAGGWMGLARILRCRPWGSSGWDPVPAAKPAAARWWRPWTYGDWRTGYRPAPQSENSHHASA